MSDREDEYQRDLYRFCAEMVARRIGHRRAQLLLGCRNEHAQHIHCCDACAEKVRAGSCPEGGCLVCESLIGAGQDADALPSRIEQALLDAIEDVPDLEVLIRKAEPDMMAFAESRMTPEEKYRW